MRSRSGAYAAIDVGSNSVKLVIVSQDDNGDLVPLLETSRTTRLAERGASGYLRPDAIERTIAVLEDYHATCVRCGVVRLEVVGTSALRDAHNASELTERAIEVGMPLRVISGEEEARLSFIAVRADKLWSRAHQLLVVDIGGGSTEIVAAAGDEIVRRVSLQLGAVRLTESCLRSDPPTVLEIDQAALTIREELTVNRVPNVAGAVVGLGGTCVCLASVRLAEPRVEPGWIHGTVLTLTDVEDQAATYAALAVADRQKIVGLPPARADVILAGALILREILYLTNKETLTVSARGLRWGLIHDMYTGA